MSCPGAVTAGLSLRCFVRIRTRIWISRLVHSAAAAALGQQALRIHWLHRTTNEFEAPRRVTALVFVSSSDCSRNLAGWRVITTRHGSRSTSTFIRQVGGEASSVLPVTGRRLWCARDVTTQMAGAGAEARARREAFRWIEHSAVASTAVRRHHGLHHETAV